MSEILQLCKYHWSRKGGIETVSRHVHEIECLKVISLCFGDSSFNDRRIISVKTKWTLFSQPLSFRYMVYSCMIIWKKQPRIVLVHAPNLLAFCSVAFISLVKDLNIVVFWHSDIEGRMIYPLFKSLERFVLSRSSKILVTSNYYADSSVALSSFRGRCIQLPLGVEDNSDVLSEASLYCNSKISRIRDSKHQINLLFVGRFVPYKGLGILIESLKILRDSGQANFHLNLVGNGPEYKKINNAITVYGLKDHVELLGVVSDAQLCRVYSMSDCLILPSVSRAEAFGVVLIEAMMRGLAVVASDCEGSGMRYVIGDGDSGFLFENGNPRSLASVLREVLRDPSLIKEYGRRGRDRALMYFSDETFKKKVIQLLA